MPNLPFCQACLRLGETQGLALSHGHSMDRAQPRAATDTTGSYPTALIPEELSNAVRGCNGILQFSFLQSRTQIWTAGLKREPEVAASALGLF